MTAIAVLVVVILACSKTFCTNFCTSSMEDFVEEDVQTIAYNLMKIITECDKRCLKHAGIWASELFEALSNSGLMFSIDPNIALPYCVDRTYHSEMPQYALAKSHFDLEEYDQAAYFSKDCVSSIPRFLHYYSLYCSGEKKRLDDVSDSSSSVCPRGKNKALQSLYTQLRRLCLAGKLDGHLLYLYGIVSKRMQLKKEAVSVFVDAITIEPLNWGAWLELSALVTDSETLSEIVLPDHWMKNFFLGHTYLELHLNDMALKFYNKLEETGFKGSPYILTQKAIAHLNMISYDKALQGFKTVLNVDPYRLDNMDTYSNLLYLTGMQSEMGELAFQSCKVDRYRVEALCVVGNFYSLSMQHTKAVLYYQKASTANPNYFSAWTLMGHEYMEMKNSSFAIQAYRQAVDINQRDYRAWYGLGQIYEVLELPSFCLYYYKKAQALRPRDYRMVLALGESYEKLGKFKEAIHCYWKVRAIGDAEGMALLRLAKLYENLKEEEQAVSAYSEYCKDFKDKGYSGHESAWTAFLFCARYYFKRSEYDRAISFAEDCVGFIECSEEGKQLVQDITRRRVGASYLNNDRQVKSEIWDRDLADE